MPAQLPKSEVVVHVAWTFMRAGKEEAFFPRSLTYLTIRAVWRAVAGVLTPKL